MCPNDDEVLPYRSTQTRADQKMKLDVRRTMTTMTSFVLLLLTKKTKTAWKWKTRKKGQKREKVRAMSRWKKVHVDRWWTKEVAAHSSELHVPQEH